MKLNDIMARLEKIAPVELSNEFCKTYKMYDNSGIIINCGNEVCGALFSLDFSLNAVAEAKRLGYNLIVTHHPAIYGGISRLDTVCDPQAKAIAECIKSGINVISMHLNFDAAPSGIDYYLMRGLGGKEAQILLPVSNGGYGRIFGVQPIKFGDYTAQISKEFSTQKAVCYGEKSKLISRVASFCGAGCDDRTMAFAVENNADVFVSSDMKHHEIAYLLQKGICVIHLTHYPAENYGFNKIYNVIKEGFEIPSAYFADSELL